MPNPVPVPDLPPIRCPTRGRHRLPRALRRHRLPAATGVLLAAALLAADRLAESPDPRRAAPDGVRDVSLVGGNPPCGTARRPEPGA